MALTDPVIVYSTTDMVEAQFIVELLAAVGIESKVSEEVSQLGFNVGAGSESSSPKLWVNQADVERVQVLLQEYERRMSEPTTPPVALGPIIVTCPDCGKTSTFPGEMNGTVQNCPDCGSFVDVGEANLEGWEEMPSEDEESSPEE